MALSPKIFILFYFLFFVAKKWYIVQKGENYYGSEPKATEISKSSSVDLSWLLL